MSPDDVIHHGDCLDVLRDMESDSIDLVYADPPFNTGWRRRAKNGSYDDHHVDYIGWLRDRMREVHRVLKRNGTIYLHCIPQEVHHVKVMMDCLFGKSNFRNEIIWVSSARFRTTRTFAKIHSTILLYARRDATFNMQHIPYSESHLRNFRYEDERGRYRPRDMTLSTSRKPGYRYVFRGHERTWRCPRESMERLDRQGLIHHDNGCIPRYKQYLHDSPGVSVADVWDDIPSLFSVQSEHVGYPTQKPLALLDRIILTSSNEGDLVMDPFCGSGTTLVAARNLGREFIGIDRNADAIRIAHERLAA